MPIWLPGGFGNATAAQFIPRDPRPMVLDTRAQQLALYVIDLDPFQMVSDASRACENQPSFQFIRDVSASWDETRALEGDPSESVTIARRRGPAARRQPAALLNYFAIRSLVPPGRRICDGVRNCPGASGEPYPTVNDWLFLHCFAGYTPNPVPLRPNRLLACLVQRVKM